MKNLLALVFIITPHLLFSQFYVDDLYTSLESFVTTVAEDFEYEIGNELESYMYCNDDLEPASGEELAKARKDILKAVDGYFRDVRKLGDKAIRENNKVIGKFERQSPHLTNHSKLIYSKYIEANEWIEKTLNGINDLESKVLLHIERNLCTEEFLNFDYEAAYFNNEGGYVSFINELDSLSYFDFEIDDGDLNKLMKKENLDSIYFEDYDEESFEAVLFFGRGVETRKWGVFARGLSKPSAYSETLYDSITYNHQVEYAFGWKGNKADFIYMGQHFYLEDTFPEFDMPENHPVNHEKVMFITEDYDLIRFYFARENGKLASTHLG